MKKILFPMSALLGAVLFLGSAISATATTISFGNVVSGSGDITTGPLGASSPLANSGLTCGAHPSATNLAICDVPFQTLTISGAPTGSANGSYTPLNVYEQFNATTNTLTMYGAIAGCATCSNLPGLTLATTLVTIVFAADLTGNATTSSFTLNPFPGVTSVTVNSTLLGDLGASGPFFLSVLTASGNADSAAGGNYRVTAGSLVLTDVAPEPGSAALMTIGLAGLAIGARKRFSRR